MTEIKTSTIALSAIIKNPKQKVPGFGRVLSNSELSTLQEFEAYITAIAGPKAASHVFLTIDFSVVGENRNNLAGFVVRDQELAAALKRNRIVPTDFSTRYTMKALQQCVDAQRKNTLAAGESFRLSEAAPETMVGTQRLDAILPGQLIKYQALREKLGDAADGIEIALTHNKQGRLAPAGFTVQNQAAHDYLVSRNMVPMRTVPSEEEGKPSTQKSIPYKKGDCYDLDALYKLLTHVRVGGVSAPPGTGVAIAPRATGAAKR